MKVGYAVLYEDGTLTISKNYIILQRPILRDYGKFNDTDVPWVNKSKTIKSVRILNQVKSNCMKEWFDDCKNLTTLIDFQNLDVSDCEDFSYLFHGCKQLMNIDSLKEWNVSSCKFFSNTFYGCESLIDISVLSNWNVSNCKLYVFMVFILYKFNHITRFSKIRCF